jgi:hypothetical protein
MLLSNYSHTVLLHGLKKNSRILGNVIWLDLANTIGCNAIDVEPDCTEVINNCSGKDNMWNEATDIYADCLASAILTAKVELSHCPGEINSAAHVIARSCFQSYFFL